MKPVAAGFLASATTQKLVRLPAGLTTLQPSLLPMGCVRPF